MLRTGVEWTEHAEHQWATEGRGIKKLVMNKYDSLLLLLLIGAAQRGAAEEAH